jgi:uncharacterized protein YjbJ (UPF0337 family)
MVVRAAGAGGSGCQLDHLVSRIRRQKEQVMNWDIIEGNWKQYKGKVREQWGDLTDDHLDVIAGKRTILAGKLQEAYGITRQAAEDQIRRFEESNKDLDSKP